MSARVTFEMIDRRGLLYDRGMRVVLMLVALAGCGGDSTDGELGGHCYPNGTCNVSLACSGGICVANGDHLDAALDAVDAPVDSSVLPDAFVCNTTGEPNDTVQTASVPTLSGGTVNLTGLTICPSGDKDTYQVTIQVGNSNLEAITTFTNPGQPVSVSILNASGASINNGTANGAGSLRSYAANLPAGTYYVQTYAASTVIATYGLKITVSQ